MKQTTYIFNWLRSLSVSHIQPERWIEKLSVSSQLSLTKPSVGSFQHVKIMSIWWGHSELHESDYYGMKLFFQDTLVPPRPQVKIRYHEYSFPTILVGSTIFLIKLLKIWSLQFKENNLVIWLKSNNLVKIWVAGMKSLRARMIVSSSFPQEGHVGETLIPHLLLWWLVNRQNMDL